VYFQHTKIFDQILRSGQGIKENEHYQRQLRSYQPPSFTPDSDYSNIKFPSFPTENRQNQEVTPA